MVAALSMQTCLHGKTSAPCRHPGEGPWQTFQKGHGTEAASVVVVSVTAPITGGNKDPLVIMFIAVNQLLKSVVMEDQSVYQSVMNLQTGAVKYNIIL